MKLTELSLYQFRNYDALHLEFEKNLTIFTGENAQGKTNLLESMHLLSLAKSHRTNHDQDLIQWSATESKVSACVQTAHITFPLELMLNKKGKIAKFNHLEQSKLSTFIGKLNTILFAPEDLQLVKGAPSLRRRFIDSEMGQSHPIYLATLVEYNKILKQRNRYLKEFGRISQFDDLYFDILTEQLVDKIVLLVELRLHFIKQLEYLAQSLHKELSNQRDQLSLYYESCHSKLNYEQLDTLRENFLEVFSLCKLKEKEQGVTAIGPHRDDLFIELNGKKAQFFASQGQQRTIVLSLKLAEIEWMYQMSGEYPILLLDDVLSELDDARQHILMNCIEDKVQTFLTTATIKGLNMDQLSNADIRYVKKGTVSKGEL